jgi:hypothetical protein
MKFSLFVFCLFLSLSSLAQKPPVKFGDIPMSDMTMTIYDKDSSAAAVILVNYGEAYISVTSLTAQMKFERHVRIKILKKEGLSWADVIIPLYYSGSAEERVNGLKASTFNLENGKLVETKLSKDGIFKEKFNRNLFHQKFTMPNVKVGSVIDYSYTISSEFVTNFPNWEFQETIPIRHCEFWASMPDAFSYERYMQGYLTVSDYQVKSANVGGLDTKSHHWTILNVPAFKEEPYMTSKGDYISKIHFALAYINIPGQATQEVMGSWAKLNERLLEDSEFGGVIKGSNFLKDIVEQTTTGMTDPMQKITAIHDYVKQNFEWDGYRDFYASPLKKIHEQKKGSSGDINLYLASMLQKAGLEVDMVLLSTRDHGFIRQQSPMVKQFNYVVCAVRLADKTIFLDATDRYLPVNVLPVRCLNGQGLVISKTRHGWINLETKTKAKTIVTADLAVGELGDLTGKLNYSRDGYDAVKMRKEFKSKGQETYVKDFLGSKSWEIGKSEFQDLEDIKKAPKEIHELTIREHAVSAGDVMYINPFVTSQIVSNPFKLENREYPVDFGSAIEEMYICKLTIPEGYTFDELPESKVFMMPGNTARYLYNVAQLGNSLTITSNLQINKNIFLQMEYPQLREFYNQVVAKQTQQIVLKKK